MKGKRKRGSCSSRIQLLVLNGNFAMMGLLQKCLMVPVMHFAPSGKRRKRNSSVWYDTCLSQWKGRVAKVAKETRASFPFSLFITVNIVKRLTISWSRGSSVVATLAGFLPWIVFCGEEKWTTLSKKKIYFLRNQSHKKKLFILLLCSRKSFKTLAWIYGFLNFIFILFKETCNLVENSFSNYYFYCLMATFLFLFIAVRFFIWKEIYSKGDVCERGKRLALSLVTNSLRRGLFRHNFCSLFLSVNILM